MVLVPYVCDPPELTDIKWIMTMGRRFKESFNFNLDPAKYWISIRPSNISRVSVSSQGWLMPKLSSVYNMHSITKLNLNCPSYCYHSGIPLATRDNPLSADLDSEARLCISNSECIFGLRMWRLCWHSGPASINCRISTEKPNRCCYLPRCKSLAQLS